MFMRNHLKTILFAAAGFVSGVLCMASRNRIDPSIMAVPFVISGVLAHNSEKAEAGPLSYFGGALMAETIFFLLMSGHFSLRPFAVCISPLAAYRCSELFHGGFLKAAVSGALSIGALVLCTGSLAAVGCGCFAALSLEMIRTALALEQS